MLGGRSGASCMCRGASLLWGAICRVRRSEGSVRGGFGRLKLLVSHGEEGGRVDPSVPSSCMVLNLEANCDSSCS